MVKRGEDERAIAYDLRALVIRLRMGDEQAIFNIQRLADARSRLGAAAFTRITSQSVDADSLEMLRTTLDQHDVEAGKPTDQPSD